MKRDDVVKTFNLKDGRILQIVQDQLCESPREDENMGTMICFHRRYKLGDKHGYRHEDYASWGEIAKQIREDNENDIAIMLPIFMMDHSGVSLCCGTNQFKDCDPAGFDSGQVGFIFVTNDRLNKEYPPESIDRLKLAESCLRAEVELYSQYLAGEVYEFVLLKPVKCDSCGHTEYKHVDGCCGFHGLNYQTNGMADHLPDDVVEELWGGRNVQTQTSV